MLEPDQRNGKYALLIGSRVGDLSAIENDLKMIGAALKKYGFEISLCDEHRATRQGILDAWRKLVDKTAENDAVVVYYTGHGGITEKEGKLEENGEPRRIQYLVPYDYFDSQMGDFRAITDVELSHLLRLLTGKTQNVTVIMDCCHSNRMARGPLRWKDGRIKALHPEKFPLASAHVKSLIEKREIDGVRLYEEGNKYVVRISAAMAFEEAWEDIIDGRPLSYLSYILAETLQDALHTTISWQTVSLRVRQRIAVMNAKQHPEIAGPTSRLLFSLEERKSHMYLFKYNAQGTPMLQAGRLHGVEKGDVFAVMPYGEENIIESKKMASATVLHVGVVESKVALAPKNAVSQTTQTEVVALLERKGIKKWPMKLSAREEFKTWWSRCMEVRSQYCRAEDEGEESIGTVTYDGKSISVFDQANVRLGQWNYSQTEGLSENAAKALTLVDQLAKIQNILAMEGGRLTDALNAQIELKFGIVEDSEVRELEGESVVVKEGERIRIYVKNNSGSTLFVHLFDTAAGELVLQSKGTPTGRELPPGNHHIWGEDEQGEITGWLMPWPGHIGSDTVCIDETFILVVTNTIIDLTCLETQRIDAGSKQERKNGESDLENVLQHFGCGYDKERLAKAQDPPPGPRYDVHHIYVNLVKQGQNV
jgi:hypothetical protein